MAKISALTDGDPAVATDVVPIARAGGNYKLLLSALKTLFSADPTFTGTVTHPSGQSYPSPTITGTVTATGATVSGHQLTGLPIVLAKWGVPVILASSGSMGNNGAVSGMTALPTTYSGGAWLYLPAGAVDTGVPAAAAFLWFVASSTTAGTVYNSTWNGAGIPPVGTTTAFATTGPGAFTGVAAGEITIATVTVPAGGLGPNGSIEVNFGVNNNTAAGNKIARIRYSGAAGTIFLNATVSTGLCGYGFTRIANGGVANVQKGGSSVPNTISGILHTLPVYAAVDTTAATTLVFTLEKATATNHVVFEDATVKLVYGA